MTTEAPDSNTDPLYYLQATSTVTLIYVYAVSVCVSVYVYAHIVTVIELYGHTMIIIYIHAQFVLYICAQSVQDIKETEKLIKIKGECTVTICGHQP